jgi:hypothetical protein
LTADLRPGAIVWTYIVTIDPPKEKFGVVAYIDPDRDSLVLFLVHTELPKFVQSQPELLTGITKIDRANHTFLDYDSWLRFGDPHACNYSEVARAISKGSAKSMGYISAELLARLIELIPKSSELSPRWQGRYCSALTAPA